MAPPTLCILLFLVGVILLTAELFLPSHGVLGLLATITIIAAIVVAFRINQWLGLGAFIGTAAATPFVWIAAMNLWPRTPMGKRMLLPPVESIVEPPRVGIGQSGIATTELRPMGWCDFDGARHEVRSESGIIRSGSAVKVVSVEDGRLIVREELNERN